MNMHTSIVADPSARHGEDTIPASERAPSFDAVILAAFEKVRSLRALAYSFDDLPLDQPEGEEDANDKAMQEAEEIVWRTSAATLPGIAARLMLSIPAIDQSRWVDKMLVEQGLPALYANREEMSGDARVVTSAAIDLLRLAWRQALTAYEAASARHGAFLDYKALVEFTDMPADTRTALDALDNLFAEQDHLATTSLIETPVPDWEAYRSKAEIAIRECYADQAAPSLLRDANTLCGWSETVASAIAKDDHVANYWTAHRDYNAGRISEEQFDTACDELDFWVPQTHRDFVRKYEAVYYDGSVPNSERSAIMREQAADLLAERRN